MNIGIIDLGTNSARLFIYTIDSNGKIHRSFKLKRMVRLGDGVFTTGKLDDDAVKRTVDAFAEFSSELQAFSVQSTRAVGTSALRVAEDSKRLVNAIHDRFGISIEVISATREAELIARGIMENEVLPEGNLILIDIGGGSTEVILCTARNVVQAVSLAMGAARGQQQYLKRVPVISPEAEAEMRQALRQELAKYYPEPTRYSVRSAFGSSGSIRALGRIQRKTTHSLKHFSFAQLSDLIRVIRPMSSDELITCFDIEPRRADLLFSAAVILEEVVEWFGAQTIEVTSFALKDGLLSETLDTLLS